jgi:hypothetical protein
MCEYLKFLGYSLFFSILLQNPAGAQLSYSVECGFQYNAILRTGFNGALTDYNHGLGLNVGFNIHNTHNSAINIQFSCIDFVDNRYSNLLEDKNTYFYDVGLRFRIYPIQSKYRPYLLMGAGRHFIDWGDVFDPAILSSNDPPLEYYQSEWNSYGEYYFTLGVGMELVLSKKFDIIIEGSLLLSKSYFFSPLGLALRYNF